MFFLPIRQCVPGRRGVMALLAAALSAGCAVQPNGRGGVLVGVDNAQLFGTTLGTFQMADGTEGALRRDVNNGAFSIKLAGTMRVIPLPNAQSARIARLFNMGQRTVLVVETQERDCPFRYEVLSIAGSDVLQWSVGTCHDRPRVDRAEGGSALYFDFPANGYLLRYRYIDGRMLNPDKVAVPGFAQQPFADADLRAPDGAAAPSQPAQPRQAVPLAKHQPAAPARVIPLPPQLASTQSDVPAAAPASPSAAKAGRKQTGKAAACPSPTPAPMKIPTEETKAIHLDLRQ